MGLPHHLILGIGFVLEWMREKLELEKMSLPISFEKLQSSIVEAKISLINEGVGGFPYRPGAIDWQTHCSGGFSYLHSRFGQTNFVDQEVFYIHAGDRPMWVMNSHGRQFITDSSSDVQQIFNKCMLQIYEKGYFLKGGEYQIENLDYKNQIEGDLISFVGKSSITRDNQVLLELFYHGGIVNYEWLSEWTHLKAKKSGQKYA